MMELKNMEIREKVRVEKVRLWQVAEKLGLSDSRFSRDMRHELDEKTKAKVLEIIDELK